MRRYLFIIIGVVCTLGIGHRALAYDYNEGAKDTWTSVWQSNSGTNKFGQTFKTAIGQNNIDKVRFQVKNEIATSTFTIYLCRGVPEYGQTDFNASYACGNMGNFFIDSGQVILGTSTAGQYLDWTLSKPVALSASTTYYFSIVSTQQYSLMIAPASPADYYLDGRWIPSTDDNGWDAQFWTYYDSSFVGIPIGGESGSIISGVNTEAFFSYKYPYLSIPDKNYCYINASTTGCIIKFTHNTYASGADLYWGLYDSTNDNWLDGSVFATSSLPDDPYTDDSITIPYSATTTPVIQYCVIIRNPDGVIEDRMQCGWAIFFVKNTDQILASCNGSYNIASACSDIASSTGSFDDLRYGVECGFRKFVYWAFTRSDQSCIDLMTAMGSVYTVFPVNVYVAVKDDISMLTEISTTTASSTFRIPLLMPIKGGAGVADTGLSLLQNNTIASSSLGTVWADINLKLSYFIYFLGFIWLVAELIGIKDDIMPESGGPAEMQENPKTRMSGTWLPRRTHRLNTRGTHRGIALDRKNSSAGDFRQGYINKI